MNIDNKTRNIAIEPAFAINKAAKPRPFFCANLCIFSVFFVNLFIINYLELIN